jgi:ketosteroid isomerase-like protein
MQDLRQENLEAAKALFRLYESNTFATPEEAGAAYEEHAKQIFHEKAVFEVVILPPGMKMLLEGKENIINGIKPLYSKIKESTVKLLNSENFQDDSKFLLNYHVVYKLHSGNVYENNYTMIIKVDEGKISRVWEYINPFNLSTFV